LCALSKHSYHIPALLKPDPIEGVYFYTIHLIV
jgi:hypothetical protein